MDAIYLENGDEEIEIDVDFDYEPHEAMTRHYPGNSESVAINYVCITETKAELCLIGTAEDEIAEKVLDLIHEEQEYAAYGYMMD